MMSSNTIASYLVSLDSSLKKELLPDYIKQLDGKCLAQTSQGELRLTDIGLVNPTLVKIVKAEHDRFTVTSGDNFELQIYKSFRVNGKVQFYVPRVGDDITIRAA